MQFVKEIADEDVSIDDHGVHRNQEPKNAKVCLSDTLAIGDVGLFARAQATNVDGSLHAFPAVEALQLSG